MLRISYENLDSIPIGKICPSFSKQIAIFAVKLHPKTKKMEQSKNMKQIHPVEM